MRTVALMAPATGQEAPETNLVTYDRDTFWNANDVLRKTLSAARSRGVGRWALLAHNLVRTSMLVPPDIVLPPTIGSRVSLSYFVAIAAASGGGKTSAESVAGEMVWIGDTPILRPTSGAGLTATYVKRVPARKGQDPEPEHLERTEWRALFSVDEIGSLEARAGSGNSLLPDLRTAWMGGRLGSTTVTKDNRLSVAEHSYRLSLTVGTQLGSAGFLLNDAEESVGTPQRFVFLPAQDESDLSDEELENMTLAELRNLRAGNVAHITPGTVPGHQDFGENRNWETWEPEMFHEVRVCESAQREIILDDERRIKKYPPHHLLCRLKTASLLSFYSGENGDVTDEYWELAGVIMGISEETKKMLKEHMEITEREEMQRKGERSAIYEVAKQDGVSDLRAQAVDSAKGRIIRALERAPMVGYRELNRKMDKKTYPYFSAALQELLEDGKVTIAGDRLYVLSE